ncbi:MAG: PD40 domain-containing protein [Deltaproteobacteria bacterium]|nr:PD40 domain-containing protein [Deltaproteobacteria bacterium]
MGALKTADSNRKESIERRQRWLRRALIPGALTALLVVSLSGAQGPSPVELVSINVDGRAGDAASNGPAVNADASFVAFFSDADDLVRGDTNQARDVFVRDRHNARTERVSVSSTGVQGNLPSHAAGDNPAIDAAGDIVAFYSNATNLVPNDANDHSDVFVRVRSHSTTEIVSLSSNGDQGDGDSLSPSISADGRLVAFQSLAKNLIDDDSNDAADIFVRDRTTSHTERVCNGTQGNGGSFSPAISADGNVVAFASSATNLAAGDNNAHVDVFACDRRTGHIDVVSINDAGTYGNGDSILPAVSSDGRYVAFKSLANNLVADDRNGIVDVFVRDRVAGKTERVSLSFLARDSNGVSFAPGINSNGRFVAFGSEANNLVPADENQLASVFVRDRAVGLSFLVDINERGEQANGATLDIAPGISSDGTLIAYSSLADNLTNNDFNEHSDVYIQTVPIQTCVRDVDCRDTNPCTNEHCGEDGRCAYDLVVCQPAGACSDGGVCDPTTGQCTNTPKPDGASCDDGNLCTHEDSCHSGVCRGTTVDCSHGDACHDAGACNPTTGLCPNPRPNGTPCNNGNLCTSDDQCKDSLCEGTVKDCATADACHAAGTCNPNTGLCPNPRPDGTTCDDHNLCTIGDACQGSICKGTEKNCATADACHDAGSCNADTGLCPNPRPNGTPCSDNNLCTSGDQCTGSVCLGTPKSCSTADACHDAGTCDAATGLCPNPRPDGTACSDGNLCTYGDQCSGSVCTGTMKNCSTADACHDAGVCDPSSGSCPNPRPDGTACSDNNLCTTGDQCLGSICLGSAKNCGVADACHDAGSCNPVTGLCPNPRPDGSACSDGSLCTVGDLCLGSVCSGNAKNCSVADACHGAGACNPATGLCPSPRPDGTSCNDGNLCTADDQCTGSVCAGSPKNCSIADACHDAGACNPTTGLCPNPRPDGTSCSDGNLCTTDDQCRGSVCDGTAKNCSVADACHAAGTCNPNTGLCPNPRPDGTSCSDGNLCTTDDQCRGSVCSGTIKNCSVADACHDAGTCNPNSGLCPNPRPDGTACDDHNLCTTGDQCSGSVCDGTPKDCSTPDGCHDAGTCNLNTGLCPNPRPNGTQCDDHSFCTVNDSCLDSVCQGQPRDCSNGLFCDGAERCDEASRSCVAGTAPCPSNACDEANHRCAPGLDKDSCHCSLDPAAPRSNSAAWIWGSAVVGFAVRRRRSRRH